MSTISDIIIILDESGSMETMGKEPVDAVNTFVETQKQTLGSLEAGTEPRFSLYTFSDLNRKKFDEIPLSQMTKFKDYKPNGFTALYDAIDQAITDKLKTERKTNVVMVIVSDGQDNSSKVSSQTVKTRLQTLEQASNWKTVYLGANQDIFAAGQALSVNRNNCVSFDQTQPGSFQKMAAGVSRNIANYSKGRTKDINASQASS